MAARRRTSAAAESVQFHALAIYAFAAEILKVQQDQPDAQNLDAARSALSGGGVIARRQKALASALARLERQLVDKAEHRDWLRRQLEGLEGGGR